MATTPVGTARQSNSSSSSSLNRLSLTQAQPSETGENDWPIITAMPNQAQGAFFTSNSLTKCLSLAMEIRESGSNKYNIHDDTVMAMRIADLSYMHHPVLDLIASTRHGSPDAAAPFWLPILVQQLTPAGDPFVEYPSYRTTKSEMILNIHLDRVGINWGCHSPVEHALKVPAQQPAQASTTSFSIGQSPNNTKASWIQNHPITDLRAMVIFESISLSYKCSSFLDQESIRHESLGAAAMAFVDNVAFFLCPKSQSTNQVASSPCKNRQASTQRTLPISVQRAPSGLSEEVGSAHSASGFYSVQSGSPNFAEPMSSLGKRSHSSLSALGPSCFISGSIPTALKAARIWTQFGDVSSPQSEAFCVADLDHLELRCFNDVHSCKEGSMQKIDLRITDNKLRLHTCADSFVALQILLQGLVPVIPESNDWNFPTSPEPEKSVDSRTDPQPNDLTDKRLARRRSKRQPKMESLFVGTNAISVDTSNLTSPVTLVSSSICSSASTMSPNNLGDLDTDTQSSPLDSQSLDLHISDIKVDNSPPEEARNTIEDLLLDAATDDENGFSDGTLHRPDSCRLIAQDF
ncbi:hypothetical protein Ciccas_001524 [Cichlidogyrus casuarinus]|uniref:Uncharacterized protein n=1 Tax=Cichlidogyrus casuarinus TaxID=1844966 RepID=A0ABD2QJS7_9PLAT